MYNNNFFSILQYAAILLIILIVEVAAFVVAIVFKSKVNIFHFLCIKILLVGGMLIFK